MTDLTPASTPLDLAALRKIADEATEGDWTVGTAGHGANVYADWENEFGEYAQRVAEVGDLPDATHIAAFDPPTVLALIASAEEQHAAKLNAMRLAKKFKARAEAAEANHRKAERKANDLFDEGIRQKNRAISAEKKVTAARELHKPVPVYTTEAGDCEHDGDCEAVEISAGSYCPVHTDGLTCNACADLAEHADDLPAYPCPTIAALDGAGA